MDANIQGKVIADSAKMLSDKSAEKVSESAEKSAENNADELSKRQKQILEYTEKEVLYSIEEIATAIGLKETVYKTILV